MEIIIEETLVIDFFLNFLILKITALVSSQKSRFLFLISALSAAFSLFIPLWSLSAVLKICLMLCQAMIIILAAFKYKSLKTYLFNFSVFTLATFLFGGGCYALKQAVGSYPLFIVALVGICLYLVALVVIKILSRRRRQEKFTYNLTIKDGDKVVEEEGYLDSGNVLYDSITNKPIILVTFDVFHKFYENISYLNLITKDFSVKSIKNGHYMKIKGVGRGTNMLVFTVDSLNLEGQREYKNVSLGLSFSGFEKSFGSHVLLHCDYS